MTTLGRRLYVDVTGREPGQPLGSAHELRTELLARGIPGRRLAAETGIDRRTWQRWSEKERAGKPFRIAASTAAKLVHAVRTVRVSPNRPTDQTMQLEVTARQPHRGRLEQRTLRAGNLDLRPGTMDKVIDSYIRTGDPEVMAETFRAGVRDDFYRKWLAPRPDEPAAPADLVGRAAPQPASSSRRRGRRGDDDQGDEEEEEGDELAESDEWEYIDDLRGEETHADEEGYGFDVA